VPENKENKDTTITFRTSEELKKKLEVMAAKESRSLSNFIELILEKAVKEKK
jgi:predicted HicB family RNase H-like nuclease